MKVTIFILLNEGKTKFDVILKNKMFLMCYLQFFIFFFQFKSTIFSEYKLGYCGFDTHTFFRKIRNIKTSNFEDTFING